MLIFSVTVNEYGKEAIDFENPSWNIQKCYTGILIQKRHDFQSGINKSEYFGGFLSFVLYQMLNMPHMDLWALYFVWLGLMHVSILGLGHTLSLGCIEGRNLSFTQSFSQTGTTEEPLRAEIRDTLERNGVPLHALKYSKAICHTKDYSYLTQTTLLNVQR